MGKRKKAPPVTGRRETTEEQANGTPQAHNRRGNLPLYTLLEGADAEVPVNEEKEPKTKKEKEAKIDPAVLIYQVLKDRIIGTFQTPEKRAYIKTRSHKLLSVSSKSAEFRQWAILIVKERLKKIPARETLTRVADLVEAEIFEKPRIERVFNRVAPDPDGNGFWYDLTNDQGQAVHTSAGNWEIMDDPVVNFIHFPHQLPQCIPETGGDPNILLGFFNNMSEDHKKLLLVDVIVRFLTGFPHCIPYLTGPPGSAKTTLDELLKYLVDPSPPEHNSLKINDDPRDMFLHLTHHYQPPFDNVNYISDKIQDIITTAVTGGANSKHGLYTDNDEFRVPSWYSCISINGVSILPLHPELIDRCLFIERNMIPESDRKLVKDIIADFESKKPAILGGIFDTLAKAIELYPDIKARYTELPRMADYALWGASVAKALGIGAEKYLKLFAANVQRQVEEVFDNSPVASAIATDVASAPGNIWTGTMAQFFEKHKRMQDFPKSPSALSRKIKEIEPSLIKSGYTITKQKKTRIYTISKPNKKKEAATKPAKKTAKKPEDGVDNSFL